jgi:copper chaperone CopZ
MDKGFSTDNETDMKKTTLKVSDMTCQHCSQSVSSTLKRVEGVTDAEVDLRSKNVVVTYRSDEEIGEKLISALSDIGYEAVVEG